MGQSRTYGHTIDSVFGNSVNLRKDRVAWFSSKTGRWSARSTRWRCQYCGVRPPPWTVGNLWWPISQWWMTRNGHHHIEIDLTGKGTVPFCWVWRLWRWSEPAKFWRTWSQRPAWIRPSKSRYGQYIWRAGLPRSSNVNPDRGGWRSYKWADSRWWSYCLNMGLTSWCTYTQYSIIGKMKPLQIVFFPLLI